MRTTEVMRLPFESRLLVSETAEPGSGAGAWGALDTSVADPFAVSLHSVTRHPPPPGGKALVYGAGALGTTATAILRALYPDVEVMVVARFAAQAELARRLGATVVEPERILSEPSHGLVRIPSCRAWHTKSFKRSARRPKRP